MACWHYMKALSIVALKKIIIISDVVMSEFYDYKIISIQIGTFITNSTFLITKFYTKIETRKVHLHVYLRFFFSLLYNVYIIFIKLHIYYACLYCQYFHWKSLLWILILINPKDIPKMWNKGKDRTPPRACAIQKRSPSSKETITVLPAVH